jgi:hypothetical protein
LGPTMAASPYWPALWLEATAPPPVTKQIIYLVQPCSPPLGGDLC